MGMLVIIKDWGVFRIKINGMELSTGENLGDKFTFQQDKNLKHKAKSTL